MTSVRTTTLGVLLSLLALAAAQADLQLASVHPLRVSFGGRPLILEQQLFPKMSGEPELRAVQVAGWEQVHHLWWADPTSRIREEIACRADAFELTHVRLIEPKVHGFTSVALIIPHEVLDGARAEVLGSPRPPEQATQEGRTFACTLGPDAVTSIKPLQYLRAHLAAGAVDFDCEPRGPWTGAYGASKYTANWTLFRDKDGWHLHTGDNRSQWGGLHDFKLVIRAAPEMPVEEVHPQFGTRWTQPYPLTMRVNIGENQVEGYASCSLRPSADAAATWAEPALLRMDADERFADTAPVQVEGASPREPEAGQPATLRLSVERDGYYLVSLLVGSAERAVGPCQVAAGVGETKAMPQVAAGEYDSWPVIGHAVDGVLEVTLHGDFRLVAAGLQPMMYENQDFLLSRGWWLSREFHEDDDLPL